MAIEIINGLEWRLNLQVFKDEEERKMARRDLIDIIKKWDLEDAKRIHYLLSSNSRESFCAGTSPFKNEYATFCQANRWHWKINFDLLSASLFNSNQENNNVH